MPRYGYARVSSTDQDCALQEARLRDAGCEVIRAERVSGASRDGRDELARMMDFLHDGDELVAVKLDRLGRSTRDVLNLVRAASGPALTKDSLRFPLVGSCRDEDRRRNSPRPGRSRAA